MIKKVEMNRRTSQVRLTVCARLVVLALVSFGALAAAHHGTARAQEAPDPNYWKQTAEHRDIVNRFVYSQSPQSVPTSYDPVREAEEVLRQRAQTLPPTDTRARSLWSQIQRSTSRAGLSPGLRALGTIGLAIETFELGWKIGTGINAKYLRIGVPERTPAVQSYYWSKITWRQALSRDFYGAQWPALDGWTLSLKRSCCAFDETDRWFQAPCSFAGFSPPAPFMTNGPVASTAQCAPNTSANVLYGWAPEDALTPTGPIEPYTTQPFSKSSPAGTPPPRSAVEEAVDGELGKPENDLLRDWLNYQLGSPGEQDPIGDGANIPEPTVAPGGGAGAFVEELEALGLTNVEFDVLSNPSFDPAYDEGAVVDVSPSPGTSVEPDEKIVVTVNRTAQQPNNGECDRSARQDPGPSPSGDEFSPKDTFSGRDPDQALAAVDVMFRWGTASWGYRHVEIGHGWDEFKDRADTQAALLDPAPEPDQPGSHRFYYFYLGPNRIPCTRRVVVRFNDLPGETGPRGIITSFAHPGWYRRNDFN